VETLAAKEMQQLRVAVEVDYKPVHDGAIGWLKSENLIKWDQKGGRVESFPLCCYALL